jgi:hypothetical protein
MGTAKVNFSTVAERYHESTPRSQALFERATRSLPGGNTRTTLFMQPYPFYFDHGSGCRVYDADGVELGGVHDVRFVADGAPYDGDGDPAYRLHALIVGDVAAGHRLGYTGSRDMAGPKLFEVVFRWLTRHSVVVPWEDVVSFERPRIIVRRRRGEFDPLHDGGRRGTP